MQLLACVHSRASGRLTERAHAELASHHRDRPGSDEESASDAERVEPSRSFEDLADEALLLAARRGGAADEVEHLAVLDSVEGNAFDPKAFVEVHGRHALVDNLL